MPVLYEEQDTTHNLYDKYDDSDRLFLTRYGNPYG